MTDDEQTANFRAQLRKLEAKDISRALYRIPLATVYRWQNGERTPPAWLQSLILHHIDALIFATDEKNKAKELTREKKEA